MDFAFTQDQEALGSLARQILEDQVDRDRLDEVGAGAAWFDERTWLELARADLVGVTGPEAHGGSGLGLVEACLVLEEIGRTVAPVPAVPTLVAALALATFGSGDQQLALLPGVAAGEVILSVALAEPGADEPAQPATVARRDGEGWRLDGLKRCVPAVHLAHRVLVPATSDAGMAIVCLLDPRVEGVELTRQVATTGEPLFDVRLAGARADSALTGPDITSWLADRVVVSLCAVEAGVAARALELTAAYSSGRVQFGRPLGSFQAVQQRAADAYIDVLAMRWTMWNAAWRLDEGLEAGDDVAVAKFWAADGGHRVVSAAQHLHGGIGVDLDYPLHRYFRWSKQIESTLGTATRQLVRLGRSLAAAATET